MHPVKGTGDTEEAHRNSTSEDERSVRADPTDSDLVEEFVAPYIPNEAEGTPLPDGPSEVAVKEFSLPRNSLPGGIVGEDYSLPDEIKQRLPWVPDHVGEARRGGVYQFLERHLLPRMLEDQPLEVDELVTMAVKFKLAFRQEHPKDFVGEFELIPAVELELMQLLIHYKDRRDTHGEWTETAQVVERTLTELKPLLDTYWEDLYPI